MSTPVLPPRGHREPLAVRRLLAHFFAVVLALAATSMAIVAVASVRGCDGGREVDVSDRLLVEASSEKGSVGISAIGVTEFRFQDWRVPWRAAEQDPLRDRAYYGFHLTRGKNEVHTFGGGHHEYL